MRVVHFNFIEFLYYCFEKENSSSSIIMICDEIYDICVLFCSSFVGRELINHVFLLFWKEKRHVFFISSWYIKKYKNVQEMHNIKSFCIIKLNFDFDNLQLKCENLLYNVFIHFCWNVEIARQLFLLNEFHFMVLWMLKQTVFYLKMQNQHSVIKI